MAKKLFVNHKCPLCGNHVDKVSDHELKTHPDEHNVEFVCTRIGRKQYFHTNCWNEMIARQKENKGSAQLWKIIL